MTNPLARIAAAASLTLAIVPAQPPMPTATPVAWTAPGSTGNFYQAWYAPAGITWSDAQALAQTLGGHLATITSAAENAFVFAVATGSGTAGMWAGGLPGGTGGPWLGANDLAGGWAWVTGEPFGYSNWSAGEPLDSCGGLPETCLQFGSPGILGPLPVWNDVPDDGCGWLPTGFIVEYPGLIYDNGPIVTNPTGGAGGAQLSELQNLPPTSLGVLGFGAQSSSPNTLADDFTVCGTWTLTHVEVFSYTTGSPTSPSPVAGVYVDVYGGNPSTGASPIAGSPGALLPGPFVYNGWTGIYRASTTSPGAARAVMRTTVPLPAPLTLGSGVYWLAIRVAGGTFVPPITVLGQRVTGNALQQLGSGAPWLPIDGDGTGFSPAPQGIPFRLYGYRTAPGGAIALDPAVAPCSSAGLTVTGVPAPGGFIRSTLSGVTGFGFIGYGFAPFAVPFCTCTVGHEWAVANITPADFIMIPAGANLCGAGFRVQGLDFFSVGGCPAPPLALTETWQITLQ